MTSIVELQLMSYAFNGPQIGKTVDDLTLQIAKWNRMNLAKDHDYANEIVQILDKAMEIITNNNNDTM